MRDDWTFVDKFARYSVGPLLIGYVFLIVYAPIVWACVTGAFFVLGAGLFTTRIVFRVESPARILFLTPVFGLIWLLFFFLLWLIKQAFGL
jgi:hypothetical protein